MKKILLTLIACQFALTTVVAQSLSDKYNKNRPVVIVCDWDKPPYEFINDHGEPAGSDIDVMRAVLQKMGLPYKFVMKEWGIALKTFERGDADIVLANGRRYKKPKYFVSENTVNYNRICVASLSDSIGIITIKQLANEKAVFKPGDYSAYYVMYGDTATSRTLEFQTPKVALMGVMNGDYKYYVWEEKPLKWKVKELNLQGIKLNDVGIPVSEIHVIGHDEQLIDEIDDQYSRLKQSGEIAVLQDKWIHHESDVTTKIPPAVYITAAVLLLCVVVYILIRLARAHVRAAQRRSTQLNEMMTKALHMGNYNVLQYDIVRKRMTNLYGDILPEKGMTLEEFTARIHPDQREEFDKKCKLLIDGRGRHFELDKRWNAGTEENPKWLIFNGHAILHLDKHGRPAYIINAVHDVTTEVEEDRAARELIRKYDHLANIPFVAMAFYDKDGWLIDLNDSMKELCGMNHDAETKRFWESVCLFDIPLIRNVFHPNDYDDMLFCQHMEYPQFGIDRYIECYIQPLFNAEGEIANYFITAFDVSDEQKRDRVRHEQEHEIAKNNKTAALYKQQLQFLQENIDSDSTELAAARTRLDEEKRRAKDSVKQKSGFMASMTHELRTPLNAIVGFTGVLQATGNSPERAEYVRIINNSTDMLQRLIDDIIEASSITDKGMTILPEEINFSRAFNDICVILRQRVQDPNIDFIKENPYKDFVTKVDITRILQVLTSFVTNAVKFTKEGYIKLGYRYENGGLKLYCADTGIGIPKEKQEMVFERFVKLDEFSQGTGMGLSVCKSIAESYKGRIGVESQGPGKGSTFWMWIPCERK